MKMPAMIIKIDRAAFKRQMFKNADVRLLRKYKYSIETIRNEGIEILSENVMKKHIFYSVQGYQKLNKNWTDEYLESEFGWLDIVFIAISILTPRDFMNIFPIDKIYDGYRYESIDYFSTIQKSNEIGLDNKITDAHDFLWGYNNKDVRKFYVNYLMMASEIRKRDGNDSLIQDFLKGNY